MNPIIKFKVFNNSKDFEDWQKHNQGVTITQIFPGSRTMTPEDNFQRLHYGIMVFYYFREVKE